MVECVDPGQSWPWRARRFAPEWILSAGDGDRCPLNMCWNRAISATLITSANWGKRRVEVGGWRKERCDDDDEKSENPDEAADGR